MLQVVKFQDGVKIQLKADVGFVNEKIPSRFSGRSIYVCVLVETSDGRIVHFARIRCVTRDVFLSYAILTHTSGPKLGAGQSIVFPALLTSPDQSINCYIMCDGIGEYAVMYILKM
jgi:ATP-dependent DNA helicase HFM1/MER3